MSARHNKFSTTDLKVALLKGGYTVKSLAIELGKSRQAVSSTINGSKRYPRVRQQVLEVLTCAN